jgi:glycosyl transferase family 25
MSATSALPPIFVVNMARDVERRRYMEARLAALGLEAEFITAVDGRQLGAEGRVDYGRERALRIYGVEMLDSEIGCYLSHRGLYQRIVREGLSMALILEDDVRIDDQFPAVLRAVVDAPFRDWLVVRFDSKRGRVTKPTSRKFAGCQVASLPDGAGLFRLETHVLGVGAYLIKRAGCERMLAYGTPIFMPIDQTMDRFWENGIVPYVVRPFVVHQTEDFGSHSEADRGRQRRAGQGWGVRARRRLQRVRDGFSKRAFNLRHRLSIPRMTSG